MKRGDIAAASRIYNRLSVLLVVNAVLKCDKREDERDQRANANCQKREEEVRHAIASDECGDACKTEGSFNVGHDMQKSGEGAADEAPDHRAE